MPNSNLVISLSICTVRMVSWQVMMMVQRILISNFHFKIRQLSVRLNLVRLILFICKDLSLMGLQGSIIIYCLCLLLLIIKIQLEIKLLEYAISIFRKDLKIRRLRKMSIIIKNRNGIILALKMSIWDGFWQELPQSKKTKWHLQKRQSSKKVNYKLTI